MSTAWTRWLSRIVSQPRQPIRRRPMALPKMERLESRETPAQFFGGVRIASADVTGDSVPDIITAAGPGGGPHIRVMNGATGQESAGFYAFDEPFRGGAFVAAGDVTGDGLADIVVGSGEGGTTSLVRIFNGNTGAQINQFEAFPQGFGGGVRVAVGDVTGDGRADIIVSPGQGGSPLVRVFDGTTLTQVNQFLAFDEAFRGGVFVAVGDTNGDGRADIICGAGIGGGSQVKVFSGRDVSVVLRDFQAYGPGFQSGVTVAAGNYSSTNFADIVTGVGPGAGPHVRIFSGQSGAVVGEFYAYVEAFRGGVYVATRDLNDNAADDILTGAGPGGTAHVRALHDGTLTEIAGFNAYDPQIGPGIAFAVPAGDDTTAPTLTLTTPQPTAPVATNPAISGRVTDNRGGTLTVTAQVDGGAAQPVTVNAGGTFTFTTSLSLTGADDGAHTVRFVARDAAGNISPEQTFSFTLQSSQVAVSLNLAAESEGTVPGNNRTNLANVTLSGSTTAGANVVLVGTSFSTTANAQGAYAFTNVPLQLGVNSFTARATVGSRIGEVTRLVVRNSAPSVAGAVANFHVDAGAQATILNMPTIFSDLDINSLVQFNTPAGTIDVELFDQQTPLTVQNLLAYIAQGSYTSSIFHRSIADFVLQGGGFVFRQNPNRLDSIVTNPAVQNEPGISNQAGTIAMAKLGGDPNSATSQFFFNLADNSRGDPQLDTQNGGFTAFGAVRAAGMSVLNLLAAIPTQNRGGVFSDIPLQNYPAPPNGNFPTDTTSANYAFINDIVIARRSDSRNGDALTFSIVSNSNTSLVTAALVGGKLTLNYAAGQSGRATIVLRATDSEGSVTDTMFTVSVGDVPNDTAPPTVTITEPAPGATVNQNPTIRGTAIDAETGIFSLTASVDGGTPVPVTVNANGTFQFTTALATDGSQDGLHSVVFRARDVAGNEADPVAFTFTLDTATAAVTFGLDTATDTAGGGVAGNNRTILEHATLVGTAEPGATVVIVGTSFTTTADGQGAFSFSNVPLNPGVNKFTVRATDTSGNAREFTRDIIRNTDPTVAGEIANFAVAQDATATILNLPAIFSDADVSSIVRFTTPAGTFELELFDQHTPLTVQNFLNYITAGRYANSIFHRSIANFVLQGGGFQFVAGSPSELNEITTNPAVANEPTVSNQLGTIALAKLPNDQNSGTSQFFFNLADNSRGLPMLDTQNGGFTAFGQLRGNGLTVIQALAAIATQNRGGNFTDIPLQNYPQPPAGNFPDDTTAANYAFINEIAIVRRSDQANGDALTYSVLENSNPHLVAATIAGGKLTLDYTAGESGRATITLRAIDAEGRIVDTTFTVAVGDVPADGDQPEITFDADPPNGGSFSNNITITGTVSDAISGVLSLKVSVDGGPAVPVEFQQDGSFSFTTAFATDGSQDGEHTIAFVARDVAGNVSDPVSFTLTLDSSVAGLAFGLSNESDTAGGGVAGNNRTILDSVTIEGTTEAGATVTLVGTGFTTTADAEGRFSFANVPLTVGVNNLTARARDAAGNQREETNRIIRNVDPTVAWTIANFSVGQDAPPSLINLPQVFSDADVNTLLRFVTGAGTFDLEMFDQFTPITVRNFLDYIAAGRYDGSIFHDVSPGAVLRGGRYDLVTQTGQPSRLDQIIENLSIQTESALSNQAGTIAMSQFVGQPNSATSQFFFNLKDNSRFGDFAFDRQNGGLAVFGALRGNGMDVANALASIPLQNRGGSFPRIPLQNFPEPPDGDFPGALQPENVAYLETVSVVRSVDAQNGDALSFAVANNTNSSLVTATITGGRLELTYAAGQTGTATITLRATDAEGRSVETSFTVTVG